MTNTDKFCLKWSEFETNIREFFRELRDDQNQFDVTLATDDGYQIQAHKIILSAGSKFFCNIMTKTNHTHPFIYLKGIKRDEVKNILDLLYNGEANVAQDDLNIFLETAHVLQVRGFQNDKPKITIESKHDNDTNHYGNSLETITDSLDIKANNISNIDVGEVEIRDDDQLNPDEKLDLQNTLIDLQIEQMLEKNDGLWKCKVCGKTSKPSLKQHAERHIKDLVLACNICDKTSKTRKDLKEHVSNYHSGILFDCDECGKNGMTRNIYKQHKRIYHSANRNMSNFFVNNLEALK